MDFIRMNNKLKNVKALAEVVSVFVFAFVAVIYLAITVISWLSGSKKQ